MIELYVAGRFAGTVADSDRIIREAAANYDPVEYRLSDGRVLGTFWPIPFDEPGYQLRRREPHPAGEFVTFEELKNRLWWD